MATRLCRRTTASREAARDESAVGDNGSGVNRYQDLRRHPGGGRPNHLGADLRPCTTSTFPTTRDPALLCSSATCPTTAGSTIAASSVDSAYRIVVEVTLSYRPRTRWRVRLPPGHGRLGEPAYLGVTAMSRQRRRDHGNQSMVESRLVLPPTPLSDHGRCGRKPHLLRVPRPRRSGPGGRDVRNSGSRRSPPPSGTP